MNEYLDTIEFAKAELQRYLNRMGVSPRVVLERVESHPGLPAPEDRALDDQYSISASPSIISISGTNPRSVLLGAYRLLTELGCRFLGPGAENELIPAISGEDISVNLTEAASLRHRGVCIEGAVSRENALDFIDWLPKLGFNSFFVQFKHPDIFFQRWYSHKYNPLLSPESKSEDELRKISRELDEEMARRSIVHHRVGHGWTSEALGADGVCDTEVSMLPLSGQRFAAEINGRRELFSKIATNTNLCYSDEQAREAFVSSVAGYAAAHPEVSYLHVWLADEHNNVCECERCQRSTLTDQYIELLNEVDCRLSACGSPVKIALLLYQELLWPPVFAKLSHPERFVMMFAPISRTFNHSYDEAGALPPMPEYVRNKIAMPKCLEENLAFLSEWQKQYDIDSFVYDYPLGRAHYGDLGYYGISKIISNDIKELSSLGLHGYISCQELRAAFPNSLPNYVMGKTLWNSELTFEQIADEYFLAAYGENVSSALDFLSALSALCSCDYFNGHGERQNPAIAESYGIAAALAEAFAAAEHSTPKNGVEKSFMQRLDYCSKYSKILSEAISAQADGRPADSERRWHDFLRFVRENETSFQPFLDVFRVLEVASKYTGFTLDIPR